MSDEASEAATTVPAAGEPDARQWPSTPYSDAAHAHEPSPETAFCVALLGDCTVACTYLPPASRPENHLRVRLQRPYPAQPFLVRNLGADGESVEDLLRPAR